MNDRYSSFKVKNNFLKLGLAKTFVRAKHVYGRIGLGFFLDQALTSEFMCCIFQKKISLYFINL